MYLLERVCVVLTLVFFVGGMRSDCLVVVEDGVWSLSAIWDKTRRGRDLYNYLKRILS